MFQSQPLLGTAPVDPSVPPRGMPPQPSGPIPSFPPPGFNQPPPNFSAPPPGFGAAPQLPRQFDYAHGELKDMWLMEVSEIVLHDSFVFPVI